MERSQRFQMGFASSLMLAGMLVSLIGPALFAKAQEGTVVHIVPSSVQIGVVGDTVSLSVRIENVTDLYSAEVNLTFDPLVLEVVDADTDLSGVQVQAGTFLRSDGEYVYCQVIDEIGEIGFKQEVVESTVSGSGVLVTITFRGKTPGTSTIAFNSVFDVDGIHLEDYNGDEIGAATQGGSVIVTEGSPQPTQTATLEATMTASPTPEIPLEPSPTPFPTATTEGVLYRRVMQVWPDRSLGVFSGRLESTSASFAVFPLGVYATPSGEIVTARTYLHFPLDVFPPGTEILHATLYVYVDSAAGGGVATLGVYRVLEPWGGGAWGGDPNGWPALLPSPIALTTTFTAPASAAAGRKPLLAAVPVAAPASALLAGPGAASFVVPTATPSTSVLGTPVSPLATPTPSRPPATATARPTASPSPTLPRTPGAAMPVVALRRVTGTWLTWDVTALARAWLSGEVADDGLALAAAPDPDAGPETAGNLLLARAFTADDSLTRPYLIVQIVVHPVTPTPMPVVLLPRAGSPPPAQSRGIILLAAGAVLVMLGLMLWGRWGYRS